MPFFVKKPIVVEAMQFTDQMKDRVYHWLPSGIRSAGFDEAGNPILKIDTLEGVMVARLGDWVIRGVRGEFYPCKPDVFEATYKAVEGRMSGGTEGASLDLEEGPR